MLLKRRKKELRDQIHIPKRGQPVRAKCAYLARFFDDYIETHSVKPDKEGRYSFAILKRELVKYAGEVPSTYYREVLKDYHYRLKYHGRWVQVTKQYT